MIMIGINDMWFSFSRWEDILVMVFKEVYCVILNWIKIEINVEFILMELFVLLYLEDWKEWCGDLDLKIGVVCEFVVEFGVMFILFDGLMNVFVIKYGLIFLVEDGVYLIKVGYEVIVFIWLEFIK